MAEWTYSCADYNEISLRELEWFKLAYPLIEPESFLMGQEGPTELQVVGKRVIVLKDGFKSQQKGLNTRLAPQGIILPEVDPAWTSFMARLKPHQYGGIGRHGGWVPLKLGPVELCEVVEVSFHCRVPRVQNLALWESLRNRQEGLPHAMQELVEGLSGGGSIINGPEAYGLFIRLRLHKVEVMSTPGQSWRSDKLRRLPLYTVLDYHLDAGRGEWIVERSRYMQAMSRDWRVGDSFRTFWADPQDPRHGAWYKGKVVGLRPFDWRDPLKYSPWERYQVQWEGFEEEQHTGGLNPWEMVPDEEDQAGGRSMLLDVYGLYFDSDDDWAVTEGDLADEVWEMDVSGPARGHRANTSPSSMAAGSSRGVNHRHGRGSPEYEIGNDDDSDGRCRRRKRGRGRPRLHPRRVLSCSRSPAMKREMMPETMTRKSSKLDYNGYYCSVCCGLEDQEDNQVVECDGWCLRVFHHSCLAVETRPDPDEPAHVRWYCPDCQAGVATCVVCGIKGRAGEEVFKCRMGVCGQYYHRNCLLGLRPHLHFKIHAGRNMNNPDSRKREFLEGRPDFTCPAHFCQSCHLSGDSIKLLRCWCCPRAYHVHCLPVGARKLNPRNVQCAYCQVSFREEKQRQEERARQDGSWHDRWRADAAQLLGAARRALKDPQSVVVASTPEECPVAAVSGGFKWKPKVKKRRLNPESSGMVGVGDGGEQEERSRPKQEWIFEIVQKERGAGVDGAGTSQRGGSATPLVGKDHWHFGTHTRGGGCDFPVSISGVKFHSKLVVNADKLVLSFLHAPTRVTPPYVNGHPCEPGSKKVYRLKHGDEIQIGAEKFMVQRRLVDTSLLPACEQEMGAESHHPNPEKGPAADGYVPSGGEHPVGEQMSRGPLKVRFLHVGQGGVHAKMGSSGMKLRVSLRRRKEVPSGRSSGVNGQLVDLISSEEGEPAKADARGGPVPQDAATAAHHAPPQSQPRRLKLVLKSLSKGHTTKLPGAKPRVKLSRGSSGFPKDGTCTDTRCKRAIKEEPEGAAAPNGTSAAVWTNTARTTNKTQRGDQRTLPAPCGAMSCMEDHQGTLKEQTLVHKRHGPQGPSSSATGPGSGTIYHATKAQIEVNPRGPGRHGVDPPVLQEGPQDHLLGAPSTSGQEAAEGPRIPGGSRKGGPRGIVLLAPGFHEGELGSTRLCAAVSDNCLEDGRRRVKRRTLPTLAVPPDSRNDVPMKWKPFLGRKDVVDLTEVD